MTGYWGAPLEGIVVALEEGAAPIRRPKIDLKLTKIFTNETTLTAYAAKTNVPREVFGEGSFDKGIALKYRLMHS